MVDRHLVAARVATVRDAIERVQGVLPASVQDFLGDRTAREVVILNVFVAIQTTLDLATHWLADAGWNVPASYGDVFTVLVERHLLPPDLGARLSAASGFRNLVAHQYGALDWERVYAIATSDLSDLEAFCAVLAQHAE